METIDADLCVVGAGIVGLAHALEGRRRGMRVALLERHPRAAGASVRNFGHVFVAALADGPDLECALRSRASWLELGARAGVAVARDGTLVVARAADELAVLEAAAADPRRGAQMLTAPQAAALAPLPAEGLLGALHGTLDLRVDPRAAVAGLAALLERDPGVRVEWGARVHAAEPGVVHAGRLTVRAPRIVLCPGPSFGALPAGLGDGDAFDGLTLCTLQMLRVAAPDGRRYGTTLATGLSLIRYPAFASQPAAADLRARLEAQRPGLVAAGIHLLVAQLPGGDLIVGDTHRYGDAPAPFRSEQLDELLLAEARALLGAGALEVRERWLGVYPAGASGHFAVAAPFTGARVVEVISGLGMTMALGHAGTVLDELETTAAQASATSVSATPARGSAV